MRLGNERILFCSVSMYYPSIHRAHTFTLARIAEKGLADDGEEGRLARPATKGSQGGSVGARGTLLPHLQNFPEPGPALLGPYHPFVPPLPFL